MPGGRDYIPKSKAEFNGWFRNFEANVGPIATALGIAPAFVTAVTAAYADWTLTYTAMQTAHNAAEAATGTNDVSLANAYGAIRPLVKMMQGNPNMTVAQRQTLQVTDPDKNPTPTAPEYVGSLPPPNLILDWSKKSKVVVHFGVAPENEKRNAKPPEIAGAKIWYRIETGPWVYVADDTNSPYDHYFSITEPLNVEYQAQWFDKKGRLGVFGDSAKCTVTP
ncbi:MAG: hypothetical protein AB1599_03225 [Planctomycetota bacterium]